LQHAEAKQELLYTDKVNHEAVILKGERFDMDLAFLPALILQIGLLSFSKN